MFGQVVDGYQVVKAVEACGSKGGQTSMDVIIADCGVLPRGAAAPATAALQQQQQRAAGGAPRTGGRAQAALPATRLAAQRRAALGGAALPRARVAGLTLRQAAGVRMMLA